MSNFIKSETVREPTSETSWVDIRKGITWGDLSDMVDEALEFDMASSKAELRRVFAGRMSLARLRAGIENWGGPDFTTDGTNVIPVSIQSLRQLDPAAARQLMALVTKHNPALEEQEGPKGNGAVSGGLASLRPAAVD